MKKILFFILFLNAYSLTAQDWQWCDIYKKHRDGNQYASSYNSATEIKYKLDNYDNLYGFIQVDTYSEELGQNKKDTFQYETFIKLGNNGKEIWRFELPSNNAQRSQFFLPNDSEIHIFTNYRPNNLFSHIYNNQLFAGNIPLVTIPLNCPNYYNYALIILNSNGKFKSFKNLFIDLPSLSDEPQMVFLNTKYYIAFENPQMLTPVTWKLLDSNNDTVSIIISEKKRKILFQMDSILEIKPIYLDTSSIPFDIISYDSSNIYLSQYKNSGDRHISVLEFNTAALTVNNFNNNIHLSPIGWKQFNNDNHFSFCSSTSMKDTIAIDNIKLPIDVTTNTNYYLLKYKHDYKLKQYNHIPIPNNFYFEIQGMNIVKGYGLVYLCYYRNLTDSILSINNRKLPINKLGQSFIMIADTDLNIVKIIILNSHINKLPSKKYEPLLIPTNIIGGNCGNVYLFNIVDVDNSKEADSVTYNTKLYMGRQIFDINLLNNSSSLFLFKYTIDTTAFNYSNTCDGVKLKQYFGKKYNSFSWFVHDSLIGIGDSIVQKFNNHDSLLITCKASSNLGCTTIFSDSIVVNDMKPHIVDIPLVTDTFCQYNIYHFKDSFYTDTFTQYSWHWFLGDGTDSVITSKDRSMGGINHIYNKSSTYSVKLILNSGFCSDTFTSPQQIYITPAPQPGLSLNPNNGCIPQVFHIKPLYNDTIVSEKYYVYSSLGFLKDSFINKPNQASISTGFNLNQKDSGLYTIKQILTGTTGCITQDSVAIQLNSRPYLKLLNDTFICSDEVLQLAATAGYRFKWNTGDTTQNIIINKAGTYWVKETNGGCTVEDSTVITQDYDEHCKFNISVYPNPFGNEFKIVVYSRTTQNINVQLYETSGKQVAGYNNIPVNQFATFSVTTTDLASAMYILHITTDDKKFTYKMVKLVE